MQYPTVIPLAKSKGSNQRKRTVRVCQSVIVWEKLESRLLHLETQTVFRT